MAFLTSEGAEYLFKKLSDAKNIKITGNSNGSRVSDVVNSIVNKADNITKAISKEVVNTSKMFKVGTGSVDVNSDVEDGFSEIGIKGVTYQNFCDLSKLYTNLSFFTIKDGSIEFLNILDGARTTFNNMGLLKPNTKYTVVVNCERMCNSNDQNMPIRMNDDNSPYGINIFGLNITRVGLSRHLFTTPSDVTNLKLLFYNNTRNTGFKFKYVLILEGDQTNNPNTPLYFEGIKGVGEKGRNLFNPNTVKFTTYIDHNTGVESVNSFYVTSDFIEVASDTDYIVKGLPVVYFYNANKEKIEIKNSAKEGIVRTPANCKWVRIRNWHQALINEQKLLVKKTMFSLGIDDTFQPYYEGYGVEVESTGKNLYKIHNDKTLTYGVSKIEDGMITTNELSSYAVFGLANSLYNISDRIFINSTKMIKGKKYSIKCKVRKVSGEGNLNYFTFFGFNKGKSSYSNTGVFKTFSNIDLGNEWLEIGFSGVGTDDFDALCPGFQTANHVNALVLQIKDIQIEESDNPTSYEHFKSDKIRFLIDEPLMRLNDTIYDEITTDGYLIRRIGKITFDGTEHWGATGYGGHSSRNTFETAIDIQPVGISSRSPCSFSNRFPCEATAMIPTKDNHYRISHAENTNGDKYYFLFCPDVKTIPYRDIDAWKRWLGNNPVTIYYELTKPIITKIPSVNLRLFKDGYIKTNTFITPETTHVVQLNKSAQIEKTVKEVQSLDNKVSKLEGLYDELLLSTSQSLDLLCLDFDLREEDE